MLHGLKSPIPHPQKGDSLLHIHDYNATADRLRSWLEQEQFTISSEKVPSIRTCRPTYKCIAMCMLISEHEYSIKSDIMSESVSRVAKKIAASTATMVW